MQQIKNGIYFFVVISILFCASCGESATPSQQNDKDTSPVVASSDISSMPPYDPAMDPVKVGGNSIQKLGDTLNMKMYIITVKAGDSSKKHTHPDYTVYIIQGGKVDVTINDTTRQIMELETGTGWIGGGPISDAFTNIGNTTVKLLLTDVYRPRGR